MPYWKNKQDFKDRVRYFAGQIGIEINTLALRPMKNKWASCSVNGNLNFNIELLALEREMGEYVIVHELLHFHAPIHGKLWKSLMMAYLGDYEDVEAKLEAVCISPVS